MDTKQFVKENNYINVEKVKAMKPEQTLFVILGEGQAKDFSNTKDGKTTTETKLQIPISNTLTKQMLEWTLSYKALEDLSKEFGSDDTKHWVGGLIKLLLVPTKQGSNTVTATVLQKPTQVAA